MYSARRKATVAAIRSRWGVVQPALELSFHLAGWLHRHLASSALARADPAHRHVERRRDPGQLIDKNLYDLPPAEANAVKSTPGSLNEALDALEANHMFLLRGDVFTKDVIETWLECAPPPM
jgi:Glutamine synthetase, catalytic domain